MQVVAWIKEIAADFHTLGVCAGDILLVHASLHACGFTPGGATTVLAGLRLALGPTGVLLMPALSYATVTPDNPRFDLRLTPANVGVIAETFRQQPGVLRSLHPTHSVCGDGPAAHSLLAAHDLDRTPCRLRSTLSPVAWRWRQNSDVGLRLASGCPSRHRDH